MPQLDLDTLWRDHGVDLQRFLRVLGATRTEAEDAVQEAFLQAIRTPPEQREGVEIAAWLRTVAKNVFLKSLRRTRKLVPLDRETIEQDWAEIAGDDGAQSKVDALKQCIAMMDERERKALHLRYTMNASRKQIAESLELSEGGAKNLLERVKAKLKECVERRLNG
ncbi:MAG: sigma-70 family RNA polymerase sigma factor [Planctomycetes bacterium]|nr:sigma-70 family RNA polymerase sigma factor [Planctomycetota bacterium]